MNIDSNYSEYQGVSQLEINQEKAERRGIRPYI